MKRFITLFAIVFAIVSLSSCVPSRQVVMERTLKNYVHTHGTSHFQEYKTITLADEVEDQIKEYKCKLNWDEAFYEAYKADYEGVDYSTIPRETIKEKYLYYKDEVPKDKAMLAHLGMIEELYPELYNEVSFITYRLSYLFVDAYGDLTIENCYGKFDMDGNMVAFRLTDNSVWVILDNTVSIPEFYDYI